ncbi:hypothetical protein JX265_010239 [Neoarthrinium moseri]|uniref:Homeobox domain-containing protein n=1 Tax=Neoarthrinium moseri TaxID=1658444 RepID=A0A9P9WEC7_9PEZI|nr:hypothetical protein JX265_010239 [Neoarthrinium moseri]
MDMQFCASSNFGPVFNFSHGQGTAMHYPEGQYPVYTGFPGLQYVYASQQQQPNDYPPDRGSLNDGKTESKPRLSKEEVERLEKVFQDNPKPSSSVKAQLADELGLERPRINNWFQNRRAKAKQERKQEEYEARRAAENPGSEPGSPLDASSGASESVDHDHHERIKPSSALFPDLTLPTTSGHSLGSSVAYDEDAAGDAEAFDSRYPPQAADSTPDDKSVDLQSPLSLNFSQPDDLSYARPQMAQGFLTSSSIHNYNSYGFQHHHSAEQLGQHRDVNNLAHGLPSPEEQAAAPHYSATHYHQMAGADYSSSAIPYFQSESPLGEHNLEDHHSKENARQVGSNSPCLPEEAMASSTVDGLSTPTDSFKSPPPPANIASRRNIARPAALHVGSLRGRSYNLGGGLKTGMDGLRRIDPTSPATAMRRIVSAGGNMAGRIQKQSNGPRSPLFLGRSTEAYLQFHSRSPVGILSAALSGTTPPTPMTPAVMNQGGREPTVSSTCSDDEAFILGHGFSGIESLKTPPETPALITNLGAHNFSAHQFGTGVDFSPDQPLLTPYFQSEFPDLTLRHVPSYVDMSDNSLPSTPLYPNMMNAAAQDSSSLAASGTQYDWDTNESITSSKSSPGQPRSRQIQFTQNITPQDYNTSVVHER